MDEYKAVTQGDQLAAVAEQAKASADALEAEMQVNFQPTPEVVDIQNLPSKNISVHASAHSIQ